jgi:hypothetical protein
LKIRVDREIYHENCSIGKLYIDGVYQCYTLEDTVRVGAKLYGKTAIPEGTYPLELRTDGTTHHRYEKQFPTIHKGTLHILDIPGYQYVLIHIGNTAADTLGCILVGLDYGGGDKIERSTAAYLKIYPVIAKALDAGDDVEIEVVNT